MIKKGDKITVEYEGRFEDGIVFDSSKVHGKALEFTAGNGEVVVGFDNAVLGMKNNEEKEFTINPEEGYGSYREELKREIPRNVIKGELEPKPGMILMMGTPNGQQFPAVVKSVSKDKITIDLNHPLAGKKLIFKIKIFEAVSEKGGKLEERTNSKQL